MFRLFFCSFFCLILFMGLIACQTNSSCYKSKIPEYDKNTPDGTFLPTQKELERKKRRLTRRYAHQPDMQKIPPDIISNLRNAPDTVSYSLSRSPEDNTLNYYLEQEHSVEFYYPVDTLKN